MTQKDGPHTFRLSASALALLPVFQEEARSLACRIADAIGEEGASYAEAGSTAAHILITEAWIAALVGRLADGRVPDPELFYAAVRDDVARVKYNDRLAASAAPVGS